VASTATERRAFLLSTRASRRRRIVERSLDRVIGIDQQGAHAPPG
jgi:hypothetical protein